MAGNPTKEIKMNFHLDTIQAMDMDIGMIVGQLRGAFMKIPADKKQVDGSLYTFEINTYPSSLPALIEEIKDFDLVNSAQKTVKVRDIADVFLSAKENPKKTFIMLSGDTINAI